jgi:hypothetical protein
MTNTPLYSVWSGVNNRCRFRDDYAGRGIFVCERWQSFENFYADMAAGYGPGLQIDRIDTKGPYSPENCRWVTMKENVRNRVVTVMVMFRGQRIPLAEACEIAGVDYTRARTRINLGFTEEADIFSTTPLRKRWGKRPAGVPRSAGASNPARSLRY